MSAEREFDQLLRSWFDDSAPPGEPDVLLDTVLARTGGTRPRPAWLVRLGGEPMPAARHSGLSRFAPLAVATAAVALLIGVTLLLGRPEVVSPPPAPDPTPESTPVPRSIPDFTLAAPGRYWMRGASSGIPSAGWPRGVTAALPAGWLQYGTARGGGIRKYSATEIDPSGEVMDTGAHLAELTMWSVGNVVVNGCPQNPLDEELADPPVGQSVEELAAALADIPRVIASQPVAASVDGLDGLRMQLTVPADADCGFFQLWLSTHDSRGEAWSYSSLPGWIHQIWIIDIDGLRFVIDAAAAPDAPAEIGPELQRIIDSIQIQP